MDCGDECVEEVVALRVGQLALGDVAPRPRDELGHSRRQVVRQQYCFAELRFADSVEEGDESLRRSGITLAVQ